MMFFLSDTILNGGESRILGERDGDNMDLLDLNPVTLVESVKNLLLVSLND